MGDQQSSVFPVYIKAEYAGSGPAFAQLTADAKKSVTDVQRAFEQGYGQVSQIVRKALSVPRNAGGSLDLNVDEYRAAAREADAYAIASREVANAMRFQAVNAGKLSKEDQAVAAAARMAATAAEKEAQELHALAKAADLTQQALNRHKSATDAVVEASGRGALANHSLADSSRTARNEQIQMGQQLQDVAISLYSGQSASVALAQQLPQLAFAFTGAEGKVGKFATALSSGFGSIALVAGGAGLGLLIDMLMGTSEEADKAGSATSRLTDRLDLTKNSYEALRDVVKEYTNAQDESTAKTYEAIIAAEKEADRLLGVAKAKLAAIKISDPTQDAGSNVDAASALLGQQGSIRYYEGVISSLEKDLREARIAVGDEEAKRATEPRYKIETDYLAKMSDLRDKEKADTKNLLDYDAERLKLVKERSAALKAYDESQRKSAERTKVERLPEVTGSEIARLLGTSITSGKRTAAQNKAAGGAANSYHLTGQAIDIPLTVGGKPLTKEGIRAALEPAGVIIKELLGPGDKNHSDHFHIAFSKTRGTADQMAKQADRAKKALEDLINLGENAERTIAGINSRWDDQPRLIDQVNKDVATLDAMIAELQKKNAGGIFDGQIAAAQGARLQALDAPNKAMRDMVQQAEEMAAIDNLRLQNKGMEAEILARTLEVNKRIGGDYSKQAEIISQIVLDEQRRAVLLEAQGRAQERSLRLLEDTRSATQSLFRDLFSGKGLSSFADFGKKLWGSYLDALSEQLTDQLFGEAFTKQKMKILGLDKVDEAGQEMAKEITAVIDELERFRVALRGAANDNGPLDGSLEDEFDKVFGTGGEIIVRATRTLEQDIKANLKILLKKVFGERFSAQVAEFIGKNAIGAAYGQIGGSIVGNKSSTGSSLGGIAGYALGSKIGALGAFGGPLGAIAGGLIGSLIGGIFKKTKYGAASISNGNVTSASNNAEFGAAATSAGGNVASTISRIAEALGGSVGNYAVSIGQTNGNWNVNPGTVNGKIGTKWQKDTIDFKKDQEGAMRWAIQNALQDGAVKGIRAGAQRLLQAGKDLETQLAKAVSFQSIFDRLQAYDDPMGYALQKLDREFENLRNVATEAGEGMVEVERLYGIERARVIEETNKQITASLRDLYDSLTVGNDARSLSERRAYALSKYDPLKDRVAAGDKTAYDDFAAAAQSLLDIERQMFGSQAGYFSRLDEITQLTKTRIDAEANIASIAIAGGAQTNPTASNDNVPVVNAIDAQTNAIIAIGNQTNTLLATLLSRGFGGSGNALLNYEQMF